MRPVSPREVQRYDDALRSGGGQVAAPKSSLTMRHPAVRGRGGQSRAIQLPSLTFLQGRTISYLEGELG
jgi:hypothetical protein